jgi:Protein of unknown function (DUF3515)
VTVTAPTPTGTTARQCAALIGAAPTKVAGQRSRPISPASGYAAAWGDPAVVLTCGGAAPKALAPTSQCFRVDSVDWLVTQDGAEVDPTKTLRGDLDFTTVGRSAYVRVRVPDAYQPAADALVDLAATIRGHTRVTKPCR